MSLNIIDSFDNR